MVEATPAMAESAPTAVAMKARTPAVFKSRLYQTATGIRAPSWTTHDSLGKDLAQLGLVVAHLRPKCYLAASETHTVLYTTIFTRLRIWASYVAMVCAGACCFLFFRFPFNFARVRGRHNIPRRGERVLFVANHTTMYDSFLIGVAAYFPEVIIYPSLPFVNFAARENYFRNRFFKALFSLLRTIPVERRDYPWLMRKYVAFLERRNLLVFYQGTRSDDLSLIKNGPAYAIAHTRSPITVIPVYHQGIGRIFSRGGPKTRGLWRWLPRSIFRRPMVIFGQPIDFSECFRIAQTRDRIAAINQRIVASIISLQSLAACGW